MKKILRKTYLASETKTSDGEDRTLIVKISTSTPDRSNDIVRPEGVLLDNYLRNPVVAFGHNYSGLSIGKTIEVQRVSDGIIAKVEFAPKGVYPLADQLFEMYKGGFMNAWSIGFIPKKWVDKEDGGRDFQEWELLEYSAVLVPDNPEALTLLRSKGIDVEPLEKAMKSLDEEVEEVKEEKKETKKDEKPKEKVVNNIAIDTKENKVKLAFTNGDNFEYVGEEDFIKNTSELFLAYKEMKEGRVLSEKNRKLISSTMSQMKNAIDALDQLVSATEPTDEEADKSVNRLVSVLKQADKIIGIALRDAKADGQLRIVRDESRLPLEEGKEGGEQ